MSERCKHCGTPWADHLGIETTCKALQEAIAENEALRRDAGKLFIHEMHMEHGNFEVAFESNPILAVLAEWAVSMLKVRNAPNFVTTELKGAEFPVSITIQRMGGETPAQKLCYLRERSEQAEAREARLREALAFYADSENYLESGVPVVRWSETGTETRAVEGPDGEPIPEPYPIEICHEQPDMGHMARAALADEPSICGCDGHDGPA